MSEESNVDVTDTPKPDAVAKVYEPVAAALWDGQDGVWAIVPVKGMGEVTIAAVSLTVAVRIAQLAYPSAEVGRPGYAKRAPGRGTRVLLQVPVVQIGEATEKFQPSGKDVKEAKRRGEINYECRLY